MFKIVRMGETERMHEKVKKISLFELSEKEAQKMKTRDKEKKRKNIKLEVIKTYIQLIECLKYSANIYNELKN